MRISVHRRKYNKGGRIGTYPRGNVKGLIQARTLVYIDEVMDVLRSYIHDSTLRNLLKSLWNTGLRERNTAFAKLLKQLNKRLDDTFRHE